MFFFKRKVWIDTERLYLRAPVQTDYRQWSELRYASKEFLTPWEPTWSPDHLSRKAFSNRVYWSQKNINGGTAIPLFMFRRDDDKLVGAIPWTISATALRKREPWDIGLATPMRVTDT